MLSAVAVLGERIGGWQWCGAARIVASIFVFPDGEPEDGEGGPASAGPPSPGGTQIRDTTRSTEHVLVSRFFMYHTNSRTDVPFELAVWR